MFSELILEDVEFKKGFNAGSLILLSFEAYICIPLPLAKTFFPLTYPNNCLISRHTNLPTFVSYDPCKKILGSVKEATLQMGTRQCLWLCLKEAGACYF